MTLSLQSSSCQGRNPLFVAFPPQQSYGRKLLFGDASVGCPWAFPAAGGISSQLWRRDGFFGRGRCCSCFSRTLGRTGPGGGMWPTKRCHATMPGEEEQSRFGDGHQAQLQSSNAQARHSLTRGTSCSLASAPAQLSWGQGFPGQGQSSSSGRALG